MSEWALARAMWLARQLALTAITLIIRMLAHPTATMALTGLPAESLSARARGTTAGDMDIMDTPMLADLWDTALRDAVQRLGTALWDAAPSPLVEGSTVVDSMVADSAAAANI